MPAGIQIGAKPDAGFDDPLGMLKDCHRRIEHFLEILCVVAERAQGRELSEEESEAVAAALRYFRVGGQRHTADEEESLFPRMRVKGVAELDRVTALEHDHREADELHAQAEALFTGWMEQGSVDGAALKAATRRLRELYAAHIAVEETIVFPAAGRSLDGESLAAMGREFQERRTAK